MPRLLDMAALFDPSGPRVWTVPSGRPFLSDLARAILAEQDASEALADALIYVPNRRSARTLAEELHSAAGRKGALILPDIRALGDLETDEAPPGTDAAFREIGPALTEHRRLGALTRLIQHWYNAQEDPMPASACLAAARQLASLLDEAAMAGGVNWDQLADLLGSSDLASHWQRSVDFLSIITEKWPDWLAEHGAVDALERRIDAAEAIASSWAITPPQGPVLIAGSTGATPASRILMKAALNVPRGAVVLPGVDSDLRPDDVSAIKQSPSHPQFHLMHTVTALGQAPGSLPNLPSLSGEADPLTARRRLIHESLAPADLTGDWTQRLSDLAGPAGREAFAKAALDGLSLISAEDETHEALLAACLLRETLETPDQTAALVTPDRDLARRVSALLKRWGIACAPSEGHPLLLTLAGRRLDALFSFWTAPEDALNLAVLMDLPGLQGPGTRGLFERYVLRGVSWWRSLGHLSEDLEARLSALHPRQRPDADTISDVQATACWLREMAAGLPPGETVDRDTLRQGLAGLIETAFTAEHMWQGRDGAALASLIENLSDLATDLGPLTPAQWLELYRMMASEQTVPPQASSHARLSIHGPLEARLQRADRLILAGLNEDVWPARVAADGFLPKRFRAPLGLPDPEERMGLAAHDFAGLAAAPNVTLLYSQRREDAPAIASRWVWRLETLAKGALGGAANDVLSPPTGQDPRPWAEGLHRPLPAVDVQTVIPRPKPPVDARPRRLSVTRIETLIRDPYAIYAESVLGLSRLDPIGSPIDARQTGTAVHAALETYDLEGAKGADALHDLLMRELEAAGEPRSSLLSRRAVLLDTARWYADWLDARRAGIERAFLEVPGELTIECDAGPFTLSAVADRIELTGGTLSILDFKTGNPPSQAQVSVGLSPQMPLQAAIAAMGGFKDVPAGAVENLTYVAFKAKPLEVTLRPGGAAPSDLAAQAYDGAARLVASYDQPDQAYFSAPRPQFLKYDGEYVRLARRDEWTGEDGDE